jgi:pimeloyl-ACP methyl ester carboxylesterase
MTQPTEIEFRSLDGTNLSGTVLEPVETKAAVVLVHGGGVTREEGGFFTRIAQGLAERGTASLRFDFRGHGASGGRQEDLTLSGVANDIRSAVAFALDAFDLGSVSVLGASFGGGITAMYAAGHPEVVRSVILINPLFNYKRRLIDEKTYWTLDHIEPDAARELADNRFLAHSPSFKLGLPMLNELFWVRPDEAITKLTAPTLIIHGTGDTFIPVESSRQHAERIPGEVTLIEIEGAQHGIAVHDDPGYLDPQTQTWQADTIGLIGDWVAGHA